MPASPSQQPAPDPEAAARARARMLFGGRVDPLTWRLALGFAFLVIAPLGLGFYALSRHYYARTIDARRQAAETQGRILETALRHQMMEQDPALMASIFAEIGEDPEVLRAMMLDHDGEIRVASQPELVGQRIERDSPTCYVCHAKEPEERTRWTVLDEAQERVLRSVLPIENRPQCHACHDPAERLNGILIVDASLAGLEAEVEHDTAWIVGGTAVLAVLLLGGAGVVVQRLVLIRLGRLRRAARSIAAGHLDERAPVEGDDVITALSSDFNDMAASVAELVGEVREQEARLSSVMNSLDDGLVVLDAGSRVVAANRSFSRRLGTHPDLLRGRLCRDGDGPKLPCCAGLGECPAERCRSTGEVQRAVFRVQDERGGVGKVEEVYASPVFDEHGRVAQVVELWRDISERVREEEHLAEIERLVSLGTLASGFSHEVNTPLATMLTCAEAALARIDEPGGAERAGELLGELRRHAEVIRDQVLRCRRVTEQFLRFSRGIPPSVEPLDLARTVRGVVALAEPTAREARVRVRLEADGRLPPVAANTEVVQHVVLNLLVNAIQSCEERGGEVTVRLRADGRVRLEIEDTGCGIAPEARRHLFEPFRTAKRQGTGLGLFLSRSFMRRFDGDVELVRSEVGVGSCFQVVFAGTPVGA